MTVIFDLDGTLTKKDTYLPFLGLCLKELGKINFSLLALPVYTFLYFFKMINNHELKEYFLQKTLSGTSLQQVELIADKFISNLIASGLNDTMLSLLNEHLQKGNTVILATASFDFYVQKLAKALHISNVICTHSEIMNGLLTGRIRGKNCHGVEKIKRLEDIFMNHDWNDTIAYSDHHSDFPLLMKASKGYLVKPNFTTRLKLKKYNFKILQ